jgi:CheY-like chemotaxis protein
MNDLPSAFKSNSQQAIEIKVWEVYLLRNRNHLYKNLSAYALDRGPLQKYADDHEKVTFRFMIHDWEKSIRQLLLKNAVPFEVHRHFLIDVVHQLMKKRIYIAEDDPDLLLTMNAMLEDAGYEVSTLECGLPLMEDNVSTADLYILDKRIPDVDGLEICKHLRANDTTRGIPVILISASRNFGNKAFEAGVNDILEKPFHMKDLLRMVARYTDTNRASASHMQFV